MMNLCIELIVPMISFVSLSRVREMEVDNYLQK